MCVGTENSLLECVSNTSSTTICESLENAAIICQGNSPCVKCRKFKLHFWHLIFRLQNTSFLCIVLYCIQLVDVSLFA